MATKKTAWAAFPGKSAAFVYDGSKLQKAWDALHAGDGEPYPDVKRAEALLKAAGKSAPALDAGQLAERLQDAWRAFHAGIHTTYLVKKPDERLERFQLTGELGDQAMHALPKEANSHYRMAFGYGRYSQGISITKALKMGIATKVKHALDTTLKLNPKHAEAHLASALWHAEIIGKVGAMIGGLTYGAKRKLAEDHMKSALKLAPKMPIVHVEHAQMLLLLDEDNEQEAADAFERATLLKPLDAMDFLDARFAQEQIS